MTVAPSRDTQEMTEQKNEDDIRRQNYWKNNLDIHDKRRHDASEMVVMHQETFDVLIRGIEGEPKHARKHDSEEQRTKTYRLIDSSEVHPDLTQDKVVGKASENILHVKRTWISGRDTRSNTVSALSTP